MEIRVRPLDGHNEGDVESSYRIQAAAMAHDIPDFPPFPRVESVGQLRHPWPGQDSHYWLAEADGVPAGWLRLSLPRLDNLHLAEVELTVHPDHRRQGIGRALHATAVEFAREHGRTTLNGEYVTTLPRGADRDPAHAAFASAVGAKAALPEIRSRLDLDTVDSRSWTKLLDDARGHAPGYSTVLWTDAVPDEYAADIAMLDGRMVLDAPMGDLDVEPEKIDVDRIRAGETTARLRGRRTYHVGMRHDATGRLVAWTTISFDADTTTHGWQHITIVDPAHRGHRLGLVVKIENLLRTVASEPALRHVNTWNAAENSHMIAINTALGFRGVDGWVAWQQGV